MNRQLSSSAPGAGPCSQAIGDSDKVLIPPAVARALIKRNHGEHNTKPSCPDSTCRAALESIPHVVKALTALWGYRECSSATDLLPAQLGGAWTGDETTAHLLHAVLSAKAGKPLPWTPVRQALEDGFRLGLFERTLDSSPWPCDLGGASAVKMRLAKGGAKETPGTAYGAKVATAELETHEVQDLADQIDELRQVTAGHALHIKVTVEFGEAGKVEQEVVDRVNGILSKIKMGWMVG